MRIGLGATLYDSYDQAAQGLLKQGMNNGNLLALVYCNSIGQLFDPAVCAIQSEAQIKQAQIDELAKTSLTQENQAAAVANADATIQADYSTHPGDYAAQQAAANSPLLSAIFGPGVVAWLGGTSGNPDGSPSTNTPGWLWLALGTGAVLFFKNR